MNTVKAYCILTIPILFLSLKGYSQDENDRPPLGQTLYKTDTSGYYYICERDSNLLCFLSKNMLVYKLLNKNYKVLMTGELGRRRSDFIIRYGEWIEYYANGKPKYIIHFDNDVPVGDWVFFYENSNKKKEYHYKPYVEKNREDSIYILDSLYAEYYPDGSTKVKGQYGIGPVIDTIDQAQPDGTVIVLTRKSKGGVRAGIWYYYSENGQLIKKEKYRCGKCISVSAK